MSHSKKNTLPHNWRKLVVQELEKQGITIEGQTITDLKSGRKIDDELTEKILPILKKIKDKHQKALKLRQQLKAAC